MKFVVFFNFTPETVNAMIEHPNDRVAAVQRIADRLGGRLESYYWMFGQYDGLAILEAPTSLEAGTVALTVAGSGAFSHLETHELIEVGRLGAMLEQAKAIRADYVPPGKVRAPA